MGRIENRQHFYKALSQRGKIYLDGIAVAASSNRVRQLNLGPASTPKFKLFFLFIICLLPPALKSLCYRLIGYSVGRRVQWGWFSGIFGNSCHIGDRVEVGHLTWIFGNKIQIGEQAIISLGCWFYGEGSVSIGKFCYIGFRSVINNYENFSMGDFSGLGPHSLAFTHGVFLPYTEGYPRKFGSIEIMDHAWLQARVFVGPGVKVGAHSIVGSCSTIVKDVPAKEFFAGAPAKRITSATKIMQKVNSQSRLDRVRQMLETFCRYNGFLDDGHGCWKGKKWSIILYDVNKPSVVTASQIFIFCTASIPENLKVSNYINFSNRELHGNARILNDLYYFMRSYFGEYFYFRTE